MEDYTMNILEVIASASSQCFPSTFCNGVKRSKAIYPGWSEFVKPYADDSHTIRCTQT